MSLCVLGGGLPSSSDAILRLRSPTVNDAGTVVV